MDVCERHAVMFAIVSREEQPRLCNPDDKLSDSVAMLFSDCLRGKVDNFVVRTFAVEERYNQVSDVVSDNPCRNVGIDYNDLAIAAKSLQCVGR